MDEKELFLKVSKDDQLAYTELFHLFTPRIYPYIFKITKEEYLAKELLQETFLRLWIKRKDLEKIEQPASWLFRIAANLCLMHLRTQATHDRLQCKVEEKNAPAPYLNAAEQLEEKDLERIIQRAVLALPPKRQEIYRLSREQGLSHQEIATRLEISVSTIKTQIGLSLKAIQEFLQKETGISIVTLALLWRF